MSRRDAVPLYKTRHAAYVDALLNTDDLDKAIAVHLAIGTGARNYTITHTHTDWFIYDNDALYYRIPNSDPCRKYGNTEPCGDCNSYDHEKYSPKTPAAGGRRVLISNEWTNPVTKEREYFGLRDRVEQYFALRGPHAPSGVQIGHNMIQGSNGDGISKKTLNDWIRQIGAEAAISADLREDQLRESLTVEDGEEPPIKDFGTDDDGNEIPDLFAHDMRATFCTQLMRNDVPPSKAITKTGHKVEKSMNRYIHFAQGEIDQHEEDNFY